MKTIKIHLQRTVKDNHLLKSLVMDQSADIFGGVGVTFCREP